MRCLQFLVVVMMAGSSSWAAPVDAKPTPGPSVELLISQLGHKSFRVREEAGNALRSAGAAALPALRSARSNRDAEISRRLDDVIQSIERAAALSPKRITLHLDKKTAKDIVAELVKQTGFKIPTDTLANGPQAKTLHSVHFDQMPFWQALDKICEATGMFLQEGGGEDTLRLTFQDGYAPYRSYSGAFRITATSFQYSRNINFGEIARAVVQPNQPRDESLQMGLSVAAEPRIPILKVGQVRLTCAQDDSNCSMLTNSSPNYDPWNMRYYWGGQQRSYVHQTWSGLAWPNKSSHLVRSLKGVVPVTILAEQRPTLVTDQLLSSKGKKFKVGTGTFTIDDVITQPNKQYVIKVSYADESNDMNYDYSRIQSVQQRVELQDSKGNKYPTSFQFFNFNSPTSAQFSLSAQIAKNTKLGPPAKLMFQLWIQMEHEVEFEFKDLPLP